MSAKPSATADLRQADGASRSVLVKRDAGQFDPFEQSTALSDQDVAMPAADPAPQAGMVAKPAFDPFEEPAAEEPAVNKPVVEKPAIQHELTIKGIQEDQAAKDEPQVHGEAIGPSKLEKSEEPKVIEQSPAAEELDQPKNGPSGELSAEEVRDGATAELVITESEPLAVKEEPAAAAEDEPRVEDELAAPAPVKQQAKEPRRSAEEELMELEKQYGSAQQLTPEQIEARKQQLAQEQRLQQQKCDRLLQAAREKTIHTISLDISQPGTPGEDYPFVCRAPGHLFQPRNWAQVTYQWKAPSMCNKPLYFEEVQLERYGHDWGPVLQPIMSGMHFFGTIPILPYKMGLEPPQECIYTLGNYRPGSCAPYIIEPLGFTWRAAALEGAAWTGGVIAIP